MEYQVLSNEFDVLVVGAGPVGLWVACELALANVNVAVLERPFRWTWHCIRLLGVRHALSLYAVPAPGHDRGAPRRAGARTWCGNQARPLRRNRKAMYGRRCPRGPERRGILLLFCALCRRSRWRPE